MVEGKFSRSRGAFSLIELSIVLVIMGLLIAGVSAGSSLIKGAELRAVVSQSENFKVGVASYYSSRGKLPGDDPHPDGGTATNKFGGNSNGLIQYVAKRTSDNVLLPEGVNAWKHLADRGIINGNFEGVAASGGASGGDAADGAAAAAASSGSIVLDDKTVPSAKKKGGVWVFDTIEEAISSKGKRSYIFLINKTASDLDGSADTQTVLKAAKKGVLPATDAASLDEKYDDGKQTLGSIRTYGAATDTTCDYTGSSANTALCAVAFKLDF